MEKVGGLDKTSEHQKKCFSFYFFQRLKWRSRHGYNASVENENVGGGRMPIDEVKKWVADNASAAEKKKLGSLEDNKKLNKLTNGLRKVMRICNLCMYVSMHVRMYVWMDGCIDE